MNLYPTLVVCLVFISGIDFSQACNGYQLAVKKIENCGGPDQIFQIDQNATAKLTSDCNVILNGCGDTKAFGTANAQYTIKKNGNKLISGTSDVCQELQKNNGKDLSAALTKYGLPEKCPVDKMKKCAKNEKIDVSKWKGMLAMAKGNIEMHVDITHDTGKSCINMLIEIKK